ncbi:hypothetical protein AX761_23365 [Rhizobium sp. 58]|nr:hypothetical protein AX761_23365 [Rhizobium sp. 58]
MAKLMDQWGNPISTAPLKREQAAPTLAGVRRPNTEYQTSGLTPAKLGRLLQSSIQGDPEAYLALAEDMEERDLHYAGVLSARKIQVAGLEVTVEAASDSVDDVANADMIRAFVERDAFETEMIDILDAIGKGFSATEIIWETSSSQWKPVALKWRDPRWFRFADHDGETPLLRDATGDLPLAPYKWIFHQAKVKSGLPIRGGIARAVCWTFLFKSFTQKDWAIFCEAYGQPLRLGKFGADASPEDKTILLQAVSNIGVDYSAIVPESMAVEFIKADVSGTHELYIKRCGWLDQQVSKVVLGQTGTTDAIAGGYAVGKVHDGVKADIERSDAKQFAATMNRDFVRPYIDLNKGPQKAYPKIVVGRPEAVDLKDWMSNVKTFVDLGGKVGMSKVRDRLGIEDPGTDEELLGAAGRPPETDASTPTPLPVGKARKLPIVASAQRAGAPAPQDAIDHAAIAIITDEWEPLVSPIVVDLPALLASATSVEDARAILLEAGRTMDVSALADSLAKLAFASRLSGETNEDLS